MSATPLCGGNFPKPTRSFLSVRSYGKYEICYNDLKIKRKGYVSSETEREFTVGGLAGCAANLVLPPPILWPNGYSRSKHIQSQYFPKTDWQRIAQECKAYRKLFSYSKSIKSFKWKNKKRTEMLFVSGPLFYMLPSILSYLRDVWSVFWADSALPVKVRKQMSAIPAGRR